MTKLDDDLTGKQIIQNRSFYVEYSKQCNANAVIVKEPICIREVNILLSRPAFVFSENSFVKKKKTSFLVVEKESLSAAKEKKKKETLIKMQL